MDHVLFVIGMWERKIENIWARASKPRMEKKNQEIYNKFISREILALIKCRDLKGFGMLEERMVKDQERSYWKAGQERREVK
jgi:hypothetical protein